jgi:hypothetical protein
MLQDQRIGALEHDLKNVREGLEALKSLVAFQTEFGDYALQFIEYIAFRYDEQGNGDDFDTLRKIYEKEKRKAKFTKSNIIAFENIQLLQEHLHSFDITLDDFDLLVDFCDGGKRIFHASKMSFCGEMNAKFIRYSIERLKECTPPNVMIYQSCLMKAEKHALESQASEWDDC